MNYDWHVEWNWSNNTDFRLYGLPKKLFVMRHAERVDKVFGADWGNRAFDENGHYKRFNLNMPEKILLRNLDDYKLDPPITNTGDFVAKRVGFALKINKCVPDIIYTSPSLRCIQTAMSVMKGMECGNIRIRVEPGLYENTWSHDRIPAFMTVDELEQHGFDVDTSYQPYFDRNKLCAKCEGMKSYNYRVHRTLKKILHRHEELGRDPIILIVAHASTVDLVAGYFKNRIAAKNDYMDIITTKVPYCAFISFDRCYDMWKRTNILPSITYGSFSSQPDFKFLDRDPYI